jgi:hypothetical protein
MKQRWNHNRHDSPLLFVNYLLVNILPVFAGVACADSWMSGTVFAPSSM